MVAFYTITAKLRGLRNLAYATVVLAVASLVISAKLIHDFAALKRDVGTYELSSDKQAHSGGFTLTTICATLIAVLSLRLVCECVVISACAYVCQPLHAYLKRLNHSEKNRHLYRAVRISFAIVLPSWVVHFALSIVFISLIFGPLDALDSQLFFGTALDTAANLGFVLILALDVLFAVALLIRYWFTLRRMRQVILDHAQDQVSSLPQPHEERNSSGSSERFRILSVTSPSNTFVATPSLLTFSTTGTSSTLTTSRLQPSSQTFAYFSAPTYRAANAQEPLEQAPPAYGCLEASPPAYISLQTMSSATPLDLVPEHPPTSRPTNGRDDHV